jgi:hypothetical protein
LEVGEAGVIGSWRVELLDSLQEAGQTVSLVGSGVSFGNIVALAVFVRLLAPFQLTDLAERDVLQRLGQDRLRRGHVGGPTKGSNMIEVL